MGADDVPMSDVEWRRVGSSINSGRGSTRFGAAAQARVVVMPMETSWPQSWNAVRAVVACLQAPARSGCRFMGPPFGLS